MRRYTLRRPSLRDPKFVEATAAKPTTTDDEGHVLQVEDDIRARVRRASCSCGLILGEATDQMLMSIDQSRFREWSLDISKVYFEHYRKETQ